MLNRLIFNGDAMPSHLETYAARQWQCASIQEWVKKDRSTLS